MYCFSRLALVSLCLAVANVLIFNLRAFCLKIGMSTRFPTIAVELQTAPWNPGGFHSDLISQDQDSLSCKGDGEIEYQSKENGIFMTESSILMHHLGMSVSLF